MTKEANAVYEALEQLARDFDALGRDAMTGKAAAGCIRARVANMKKRAGEK